MPGSVLDLRGTGSVLGLPRSCVLAFLTTALAARSERGKGCGVIITEERYAEMKEEIEEELRAEEAAKRRAEKVPHRSPALANIQTVLYLTVVA